MNGDTQDGRPLAVLTPLGQDKLLLVGFSGQEAISRPFNFRLDTLAKNKTEVAPERLLGQKVTVELQLPAQGKRHFNGIVNRVIEGTRGLFFTEYTLGVVPQLWLLARKAQSRIFQHLSVPDILKKVFEGLDVHFELQRAFHPQRVLRPVPRNRLEFREPADGRRGHPLFF